jgi:hypothetical protein
MDDKEIALISGVVNGTNMLFYHLVNELDATGAVSKTRLADVIDTAVAAAEAEEPASPGRPRMDFIMMRNLVKLLRDPNPPSGKLPAVH